MATASPASIPSRTDVRVPPLRRRFLSMTYEAVLLFAVLFIGDYLFDTLTQSRDASMLRNVRQAWLFGLVGLYFVWFWVHGGQTLAMKTWHVRLEARGGPLGYGRAIARYLLLWMFVLPTLAIADAVGLPRWETFVALAAAIIVPPFYAYFDRDRQFLHDRLLGTRLVSG
jgi:RDD family